MASRWLLNPSLRANVFPHMEQTIPESVDLIVLALGLLEVDEAGLEAINF